MIPIATIHMILLLEYLAHLVRGHYVPLVTTHANALWLHQHLHWFIRHDTGRLWFVDPVKF